MAPTDFNNPDELLEYLEHLQTDAGCKEIDALAGETMRFLKEEGDDFLVALFDGLLAAHADKDVPVTRKRILALSTPNALKRSKQTMF